MNTRYYLMPFGWFMLANVGIFILVSFSLRLFGLDQLLVEPHKLGLTGLWVAVTAISSSGAVGLILGSKFITRFYLGARLIDEAPNTKLQQLKLIIDRQARQAGIRTPRLAIYASAELNAFAVGKGRWDAMLVLSQSLLDSLTLDELSAVIGHEMTHITNGDMLALTLMQGTVNMWVEFPARLLATGLDKLFFNNSQLEPVYKTLHLILLCCFGGIAHLIVMWFSREREFRADAGGAKLAGQPEMLAALRRLQAGYRGNGGVPALAVLGLNTKLPDYRFWRIFTSHPSLAERIRALSKVG